MARVSFEAEVYVYAHNLPEALEKLARGDVVAHTTDMEPKYEALDFIKPQVWSVELDDYVPCNVIMFPVKDEVEFEEE
jgi:hypothetical protein